MIDHLIRILKNAVGLPVLIAFVSVGILSADAQSNDSIFEVVPKESFRRLPEILMNRLEHPHFPMSGFCVPHGIGHHVVRVHFATRMESHPLSEFQGVLL